MGDDLAGRVRRRVLGPELDEVPSMATRPELIVTIPTLIGLFCALEMCGNPVMKLEMLRIPTLWWLRPVSSAARVGEQTGFA